MRTRKPPIENLSGREFGDLKVVAMAQDFTRNSKGAYFAICECKCGKKNHWVLSASLKRGATTSCGCSKARYEKTRGINSKLFTGHKELHGKTWGTIKRKAELRGILFELTIEEAYCQYEKQNKQCALTGLPLVMTGRRNTNTASLDRLDANDSYRVGNIQWVHKDVNIMRNVFSVERFIDLCRKVVEHNEIHRR